MSARPEVPRLAEEDLDLLISRSLDGDLSPEEEQQLARLVALDPAAARRKADLAALVAETKALPEPAAPFALATRVNSNVGERGGRPGSLGGRVGFFPNPVFVKAALLALGIVGAAIAILRPIPKRAVEGPVDVLLYSPPPPASAPESVVAEARPARPEKPEALAETVARDRLLAKEKALAPEADERKHAGKKEAADRATSDAESTSGEKRAAVKLDGARRNEVAAGASAVAEEAPKQRADRDEGAVSDATREQAPAKVTSQGALSSASSPAPAAAFGAPAGAAENRAPRGWTVSVRGDAVRRWSLRRAPDNPPPAGGTAVYRVALDADGRVTALSRLGAGPADPRLDAFVRGMVFEPIPAPAEVQSRLAAKDAPGGSADFEIELAPR